MRPNCNYAEFSGEKFDQTIGIPTPYRTFMSLYLRLKLNHLILLMNDFACRLMIRLISDENMSSNTYARI